MENITREEVEKDYNRLEEEILLQTLHEFEANTEHDNFLSFFARKIEALSNKDV